jgi:RNA polymerase sigma-70 factor (ECF subfamily)
LREEAIYLCSIVCKLMPEAPEAWGLLALMTFVQARRAAQSDVDGNFVPLGQQDVRLWDRDAIVQADQWLWTAAQKREPGPYQMEAAVQSAHCHRLFTGTTPWDGVAELYQQINAHFPTQGSLVAGAVARAEAMDVAAGLRQLEAMDSAVTKTFQPWWVARAYLLSRQGAAHAAQAAAAYQTAIGLTSQQALRDHLQGLRQALVT